MASFYEPNQGANALDQMVSNMQQQRREDASESAREKKEQDANTRFNIAYGNKLLGHADVSGGHWSPQYNALLNKSLQELGQNSNVAPAQYAMLADTHAAELASIHNTQAEYNQKVENYAGQVKALGGDPTLFKNNVANQAFTTDGKTPRDAKDIDVQGAIDNVMAKPELYTPNPDAILQSYFKNIKPVFDKYSNTQGNAATGASTTRNATYSYVPGFTKYNPVTEQVEPVGEQVVDKKNNPISGRMMLSNTKYDPKTGQVQILGGMDALEQSPTVHNALVAKLRSINPSLDPNSNEGKDFMKELAYKYVATHLSGNESVTTKDIAGDATRPQRAMIAAGRYADSKAMLPLNEKEKKLTIEQKEYELAHPKGAKGGSLFSPAATTTPATTPTDNFDQFKRKK